MIRSFSYLDKEGQMNKLSLKKEENKYNCEKKQIEHEAIHISMPEELHLRILTVSGQNSYFTFSSDLGLALD